MCLQCGDIFNRDSGTRKIVNKYDQEIPQLYFVKKPVLKVTGIPIFYTGTASCLHVQSVKNAFILADSTLPKLKGYQKDLVFIG